MAQRKSIDSVKKEILTLQEHLKKLEQKEILRVGSLAAKAGILNLTISDEDLLKEFTLMVDALQKKSSLEAQKSSEPEPNSLAQRAA
jgi:TraC-like protein